MGLFCGSMLIICTVTLNLRKLYNYKFVKVCVLTGLTVMVFTDLYGQHSFIATQVLSKWIYQ